MGNAQPSAAGAENPGPEADRAAIARTSPVSGTTRPASEEVFEAGHRQRRRRRGDPTVSDEELAPAEAERPPAPDTAASPGACRATGTGRARPASPPPAAGCGSSSSSARRGPSSSACSGPTAVRSRQATAVVLGFVVIAGAYLGLADAAAQKLIDFIL